MQKERYKLGLIFNFDPSWMGGIIYLINISRVLNFLEDKDKPQLLIFYPESLQRFVDEIEYPYMKKVKWTFPAVTKGYLISKLKRRNIFVHEIIEKYNLDGIYPMHNFPIKSKQKAKQVSWYADLQHKYYPEFFTKRKLIERDLRVKDILKNASDLVVSSESVKNDFHKFFKIPNTINFHVYHFVSILGDLPNISETEIRQKYELPDKYYMISNQFHKHKNHIVALKALAQLKNDGQKIHFAVTGKFPSKPESQYMKEIHDLIEKENLSDSITFLGLLPRGDQLLLMKFAKAIIQPSLFEGWSTVIEDARSLQVPVIASSLPVNIEQLGDKGKFFEPHDHNHLKNLILEEEGETKKDLIYAPYEQRMKEAAYTFISIFKNN